MKVGMSQLSNYMTQKIFKITKQTFIKGLAYDEILASFLVNSEIRKKN